MTESYENVSRDNIDTKNINIKSNKLGGVGVQFDCK